MKEYSFTNDYSEGCHPSVLEALSRSNLEQHAGYGEDVYTERVTSKIRTLIDDNLAEVHLVSGGTLSNLLVLASVLKPFESVVAADMGHINTHETGAIEATGHKIETVPSADGKLTPTMIAPLLDKSPLYHTVKPRLVYISNTTEVGAVYTKQELVELSAFCSANNLLLFMDGARLPVALMASSSDLSLADIACLTDVFYLGGTKCGALFGEAIVITNNLLKADFKYHQKQRGALLAKGRALGVQFDALLFNNLVFELAAHANKMACAMAKGFTDIGYTDFLTPPQSNQIFPILPLCVIQKLQEKYDFYIWQNIDKDKAAIRLVTSWATPQHIIDRFLADLKNL